MKPLRLRIIIIIKNAIGFLLLLCLSIQNGKSQVPKKPVTLTGQAGLYGDFYHLESDSIGAVAPRRPDFLGRMVVNVSLNIRGFSLPITMALPTKQYGIVVPPIAAIANNKMANLNRLVQNPLNQIGIAPKYKWMQVMLGSQIPQYSALSVGDLSIFGMGIALTPGKFRFSAFTGKSQLAVEPDSIRLITGVYTRKISGFKIGFGKENEGHCYFIGSAMKDDTTSLKTHRIALNPQNGIVGSFDFKIKLNASLHIQGEAAGSAFNRNSFSQKISGFTPQLPEALFITRTSTRMDYASYLSLVKNGKLFSFKTTARYIGDGYVSTGYPFMQTDRAEITFDPRFNLLKNKIQVSGSIGRRINNLSENRASTSTQTLGMGNLNIQFTQNLSLNASYTNFGFKNNFSNDTFKIEIITQSYSIGAAYQITGKANSHNISAFYTHNNFTDLNIISGASNLNNAINGVFSYTLAKLENPFTASAILSYFNNTTQLNRLNTQSLGINIGYKFFHKKLTIKTGLLLANNLLNNAAAGKQILANTSLKYTIHKKLSLSAVGSVNLFDFGSLKPGISYRENLLRTSINYNF